MKNYLFLTAVVAFFLDVAPMPSPTSCGSHLEDESDEPESTVVKPAQADTLQTTPSAQANF